MLHRRHVADHDLLVGGRVEREHAQLEPVALLPLEECRVEHLVDDLLVDGARLVALDDLAFDHLAVDLEREADQERALRDGEPERALAALAGSIVEHVGNLGDGHVAGGLDVDVHALQLERLHAILRDARLHAANACAGICGLHREAPVRSLRARAGGAHFRALLGAAVDHHVAGHDDLAALGIDERADARAVAQAGAAFHHGHVYAAAILAEQHAGTGAQVEQR